MSIHAYEGNGPCRPQDGDTLESIAARESAAGNPLTAGEIARFNWGTDDPEEIQAFLRDELGARTRDAANHFVVSVDDERKSDLRVPRKFARLGLPVDRRHTLRVLTKDAPKQFLACCHIPGITFAFDKSFVRPSVRIYLKNLERLAKAHPQSRIVTFGHTDLVGDELYNKKLSERRAWAVHAYIVNDTDAWETLYNHDDEDWGMAEIQEMLTAVGHDAGPPDGEMGDHTRAAMRSFLGLPPDAPVSNDAAFRKQLFAAYMSGQGEIDIPRERFAHPAYMGCGEINPVEASEGASELNRRVTFFLFHEDRMPKLPCAYADIGPCQRQRVSLDRRHHENFTCSFYDSLSKHCRPSTALPEVYLLDGFGDAIPHARWRARDGERPVGDGVADAEGLITLPSPDLSEKILLEWSPPSDDPLFQDFLYSAEYFVRIPQSDKEQACRRMLHNLGFHESCDEANVRAFQEMLGLRVTGAYEDIADLAADWHGTGTRPGSEDAGDDADLEETDPLEDSGPAIDVADDESMLEEGEPLHPEDVLEP